MPEEHQCRGEEVPTVADERIFVSMTGKCSGRLGQFQREHEGTQEGNSMATIGLYHPFIHFKDDDWLKLSALYWDRMARIVPPSYWGDQHTTALAKDSSVTRALIDNLDYVVNIPPNEVTYPVSDRFTRLLTAHAAELRNRYDVRKAETWPFDPVTANYAQLRNPHLAYVNSAKLNEYLAQQLQHEHLALRHNEGNEVWIGMHSRLAAVYMAALAEEIAVVNKFTPAAEETIDHVAALGWGLDRLAAALLGSRALLGEESAEGKEGASSSVDPEVPATLALVAIQTIAPKDPAALTVDKVVSIRRQFGPELFRLQEFMEAFASERLSDLNEEAADPNAVRAHLQVAYEHEIKPMVSDLKRALRGHGVDTVEAAMGTSITMPPALSAIPVDNPFAFGAAAVLSLVPVLRAKRRSAQQAYRESPVGYLFRLEQELQPHALIVRMGQRVRSFVLGV